MAAPRAQTIEERVLEIFGEVGFPSPERAWSAYPFELSGGLRQRAVIAMAMIGNPALVIADEPTTALDVTTQAMVLDLLARLQRDHKLAVIMITHDLGVVANMADKVVVLRRGRIVESGPAADVLAAPGHGYTRALLAAAPRIPHRMAAHAAPSIGSDRLGGEPVQDLSRPPPRLRPAGAASACAGRFRHGARARQDGGGGRRVGLGQDDGRQAPAAGRAARSRRDDACSARRRHAPGHRAASPARR